MGVQDSPDDARSPEDAEPQGYSPALKGTRHDEPDAAPLESVTEPIGTASATRSDSTWYAARTARKGPVDPEPPGSPRVRGLLSTADGSSSDDDSVDFEFDGDVSILEMLEH